MFYIVKGVDSMQKNPYNSKTIKERLEVSVEAYGDMLFRIALNMLGNVHDSEDAVQETYLRYMKYEPEFTDGEHEKRWLLRVLVNVCKNLQKRNARRAVTSIDELANLLEYRDEEKLGVIESIMQLPEKYRTVMDLCYVEGISAEVVASVLSISYPAVRKRLEKGRKLLKIALESSEN